MGWVVVCVGETDVFHVRKVYEEMSWPFVEGFVTVVVEAVCGVDYRFGFLIYELVGAHY